ncbi:MAG: DALR anticodon-binding domain-containing protein, partial [bacterium]|nr:DALR anticodon-binding domain-containing protein [bacterium]
IMRKLAKFSETVEQAAAEYSPHHLCRYLFELSQDFNAFYESSPVIAEKDEKNRSFRLELVSATAQVLKNGLNLLGIESVEKM